MKHIKGFEYAEVGMLFSNDIVVVKFKICRTLYKEFISLVYLQIVSRDT